MNATPSFSRDHNNQISFNELNDDILHEICTAIGDEPTPLANQAPYPLKSLSMVNRRLRHLLAPKIFRRLSLDGNIANILRALKVLQSCPELLHHTRSFKFDLYRHNDSGIPTDDLPGRLVSVLSYMPKLQHLAIILPEYHTAIFDSAFATAGISFNLVKTLVAGAYCEFVVPYCPNVESIASNQHYFLYSPRAKDEETAEESVRRGHATALVEAAGRAAKLTAFEMSQKWSAAQLCHVYEHMPLLRRLGMPGESYESEPEEYLLLISKFEQLQELALASARELSMAFRSNWSNLNYAGPGGEEVRRQQEELKRQVGENIAGVVFEVCKSLKKIWIGEYSFAAGGDGNPIAKEYLMKLRGEIL
ncbi:hypothetical protein NA57DRAFT_54981 [Rhizodiscina lignyota]|uniref:Uncharacterized protein n=1 Tax=Rhizodiscina lignyota TaxID=1504668 RepID=A0A9P4IJ30_9PEZI|nr:hypothetical protein NA57DRAFT_54981 [Rhizodiscina lignyota]